MQIGELAQRTGVSVRMLRHYEHLGMLAPRRLPSGYRYFSTDDLDTVRRIRSLSRAGLRLRQICLVLPCTAQAALATGICTSLRTTVADRVREIDEQIRLLRETRRILSGVLARSPVARSQSETADP